MKPGTAVCANVFVLCGNLANLQTIETRAGFKSLWLLLLDEVALTEAQDQLREAQTVNRNS